MPSRLLALSGEEAGRPDDLLELLGVGAGQVLGRRVAGEERGRHHVHPDVGGLRREDRGRQELERVARGRARTAPSGYSSPRRRATSRARPFGVAAGAPHRRRWHGRGHGAAGYAPVASGRAVPGDQAPDDADRHRRGLGATGRRRAGRRASPARRPRLARPGRGRAGRGSPASWPGSPGTTDPVAYAQVTRGNDSWALELVVDPHHRDELATIGPALLDAARRRGRRRAAGGTSTGGCSSPRPPTTPWPPRSGSTPGRDLLPDARGRCRSRPHADLPTRPFRVGRGRGGLAEVNNRAFHYHPEQGGWTSTTLLSPRGGALVRPRGLPPPRARRPAGRLLLDEGARRPRPAAGRDLRHRRRPRLPRPRPRPGARPRRPGPPRRRRGITVGMLYVDADNNAAVAPVRALGFTVHRTDRAYTGDVRRDAVTRLRPRRAARRPYDLARPSSASCSPASRATGSTRSGTGSTPAGRAARGADRAAQGAAGPARRPAARGAGRSVTERRATAATPCKSLWRLADGVARRDGAHALPRAGDGVRLHPGRLRHGLRVLRHRPGRLRPAPDRRRDRRAGRAGGAARPGARAGGCPTSCSWAWASRWPTTTACGRRSSGSTATSACRPATSRCPPSASCPGIRRLAGGPAGEPGRVAARRQRRAARRAGADQPPLPARRADGGRARATSRPRAGGLASSGRSSTASTTGPATPPSWPPAAAACRSPPT